MGSRERAVSKLEVVYPNSNRLRADPPPKEVEAHFASFRRRVDMGLPSSRSAQVFR